MDNKIAKKLCELGVCDEGAIELFYPRVRDRDDVAIMRCKKSGVIFTSTTEHMNLTHYSEKPDFDYWKEADRKKALIDRYEDDSVERTSSCP